MPAGRDQVDYTDLFRRAITVKIDNSTITYSATAAGGSAQVGLAVTWSANDTVALTQDGNYVLGEIESVESDNFATVIIGGFSTMPGGDAATLTRGAKIVGALRTGALRGGIRAVNTAVAAELGVARGAIANNADTTAVVVDLDQ